MSADTILRGGDQLNITKNELELPQHFIDFVEWTQSEDCNHKFYEPLNIWFDWIQKTKTTQQLFEYWLLNVKAK